MQLARYLETAVAGVLEGGKMAFIRRPASGRQDHAGPAHARPGRHEKHPAYFNSVELPPAQPLLVFDEIHKYARWRNLVKGSTTSRKSARRILVTGSERLDHYRKGGDSLASGYRCFRLHPFPLPELAAGGGSTDLEVLLKLGGFPEPLIRQE